MTDWSTSSSATRSSGYSSAASPGPTTRLRRSPPDGSCSNGSAESDATPSGPIPLGGGVHTGIAYVGPTGPAGAVDDFTALGDVVNTTARLASAASAGELLVSVDAATEADATTTGFERRTLDVRGREASIEVLVLHPVA